MIPGVIDADAHLTEASDVWTSRVASRYVDSVPHVERRDGRDVWLLGDVVISAVGETAPVGWDDWPNSTPPTYADCHPASYDSHARLAYMDSVDIAAQVLYPNVAGFGAQQFLQIPDADLKLACVRAYNDYLIEWTSASPERLLGVLSLPFWDVEASVAEIERCAAAGLRGILFTGEPQRFGMPLLGDPHWDRLWSVATDTGLPVHFHLGGSEQTDTGLGLSYLAERSALNGLAGAGAWATAHLFMKNAVQVADLVTSGLLDRFPDVKFVSVESGVGWLPFLLQALDYHWLALSPKVRRKGELLPSELFRRQVYCTFWFEDFGAAPDNDGLPVANLLFETDFPHVTCLFDDDVQDRTAKVRSVWKPEAARSLLWENAAKLYRIDASGIPI